MTPSTPYQAQQLAYDAMESMGLDHERAVGLCRQALAIDPDCVDAILMLAELECDRLNQYTKSVRRAVAAGRRQLGPKLFKQERGNFWLMIETRPFMRAMAKLGECLVEWDQDEGIEEAITVYEEMLSLNEGDNLGVRYPLLGCYLRRRHYDLAAKLIQRFGYDDMAAFSWGHVLLAFATEGETAAEAKLAEARERNPHVEKYLTSRKRLPRHRMGGYSPGDESEAIVAAECLYPAWKKHATAKRWLKQQTR